MQHRRFAPSLAALALIVAALTACANTDESPPPTPVPTLTATPSTTPATSATLTATPSPTPTASPTPTPPAPPAPTATPTPDARIASTSSTPTEDLPVARFTRTDGVTFELPVEVPPRDEYSIGLSGRYHLQDRGMLFWYTEDVRKTFWMKDTHIDLSIAFVDDAGLIVEIFDMEAESLDFRTPGQVHRYAIEAPLGWYAERGITAGDTVTLEFEIPEFLRQ